ncbi:hypothetical protein TNCV_1527311 [Trichonephila clavipes]|nr:hypothetical protein TNCV_1527311 [Trichonephila clavipes]
MVLWVAPFMRDGLWVPHRACDLLRYTSVSDSHVASTVDRCRLDYCDPKTSFLAPLKRSPYHGWRWLDIDLTCKNNICSYLMAMTIIIP